MKFLKMFLFIFIGLTLANVTSHIIDFDDRNGLVFLSTCILYCFSYMFFCKK